jgi:hypothetical protein
MLVGDSGKRGTGVMGGKGMTHVKVAGTTVTLEARMVGKSSHGWQYSQLILAPPSSYRPVTAPNSWTGGLVKDHKRT